MKKCICSFKRNKLLYVIIPFIGAIFHKCFANNSKSISCVYVKDSGCTFQMKLPPVVGGRFPIVDTLYLRKRGIYEPNTSKALKYFLRPGMKVLEIGAAYGYFTAQMSKLVGDSGEVWSFEADSGMFSSLSENVKINNLSNVRLQNKAIGASENLDIVTSSGSSIDYTGLVDIIKKSGVFDFIFIDIDAHNSDGSIARQELPLVKAIMELCPPRFMFLEYIERDSDYNEIMNIFREAKYEVCELTKRHFMFSQVLTNEKME